VTPGSSECRGRPSRPELASGRVVQDCAEEKDHAADQHDDAEARVEEGYAGIGAVPGPFFTFFNTVPGAISLTLRGRDGSLS
jgi:hypothetical protein